VRPADFAGFLNLCTLRDVIFKPDCGASRKLSTDFWCFERAARRKVKGRKGIGGGRIYFGDEMKWTSLVHFGSASRVWWWLDGVQPLPDLAAVPRYVIAEKAVLNMHGGPALLLKN